MYFGYHRVFGVVGSMLPFGCMGRCHPDAFASGYFDISSMQACLEADILHVGIC